MKKPSIRWLFYFIGWPVGEIRLFFTVIHVSQPNVIQPVRFRAKKTIKLQAAKMSFLLSIPAMTESLH